MSELKDEVKDIMIVYYETINVTQQKVGMYNLWAEKNKLFNSKKGNWVDRWQHCQQELDVCPVWSQPKLLCISIVMGLFYGCVSEGVKDTLQAQ